MDDKFRAILESLPKKRRRSRLEPWTELIVQLRRRGRTYREITRILAEHCDLIVASTTIVRFVAARSKEKRKRPKRQKNGKARGTNPASIDRNVISAGPDDDEVWRRIEELKQRPAKSVQPPKQFEYDPDQPLHLPDKK
jgi:hypothetical protein